MAKTPGPRADLHLDGRNARLNQVSIDANPHESGTVGFLVWAEGWREADRCTRLLSLSYRDLMVRDDELEAHRVVELRPACQATQT